MSGSSSEAEKYLFDLSDIVVQDFSLPIEIETDRIVSITMKKGNDILTISDKIEEELLSNILKYLCN